MNSVGSPELKRLINKCLPNKRVIHGNGLELQMAGAFLAPPLNSLPVWEWESHPGEQVPCQHQPLVSMSQCRALQALKANYSSFVLGTEAHIPHRFL